MKTAGKIKHMSYGKRVHARSQKHIYNMLCCGIIKNKYSKKIGNNLLVHTKPMTFQYKQPCDKTGFFPFVGKTIVIHIRLTLRLCEVPIQLLSFSSVSVPKTALFYNAETKYKPYKEACACLAMYFRSLF